MKIEKLKYEELEMYKELIDEAFEWSNAIERYKEYDDNSDIYQVIVAKINDKIVGTVTFYKINLFTFSFQPSLEIFNVCVKEDYRRQGVAKELFNYIFDYARKNGFKQIYLTCLDNAIITQKFYESVGFKKMNSLKYGFYL